MRIKDNYKVRQIAGENLIVEQGKSQADMTKVTIADGAAVLVGRYGISQEQAEADVRRWADTLIRCGIVSE